MRGGTNSDKHVPKAPDISIHPPRAGWDCSSSPANGIELISIHPPRAGWDRRSLSPCQNTYISIHPPRAGWDTGRTMERGMRYGFQSTHPVRGGTKISSAVSSTLCDFNPPTPCGVGPRLPALLHQHSEFQSTHPVRGGTFKYAIFNVCREFQSTHPVRGGTFFLPTMTLMHRFQSTHPVRGGTLRD